MVGIGSVRRKRPADVNGSVVKLCFVNGEGNECQIALTGGQKEKVEERDSELIKEMEGARPLQLHQQILYGSDGN